MATLAERRLPPIAEVSMAIMMLVISGGIYVGAKLPGEVPLTVPILLVVVAYGLLAFNILQLSRISPFAWDVFKQVAGWSLAGYAVISGLLLLVFLRDDVPNDTIAVLVAQLVLYAINIPLLFGFSVARYQEPDPAAREG